MPEFTWSSSVYNDILDLIQHLIPTSLLNRIPVWGFILPQCDSALTNVTPFPALTWFLVSLSQLMHDILLATAIDPVMSP